MLLVIFLTKVSMGGKTPDPGCSKCAEWNLPQKPFRIYGNTYYVGPRGLSSILITGDSGLILIDGALPQSAAQIAANIRTLGFRVEDVKLILNSHAHYDHAGGLAELQRLSGAEVAASAWSAKVLRSGGVARDDPQHGDIRGIPPVARVRTLRDGETVRVGNLALTAHLTPGHTPGGTSWTWRSCEAAHCVDVVYADSLSAISPPGFRYTDARQSPGAAETFAKSFAFLDTAPCDVLLTPHPEASDLWNRVAARESGAGPAAMVDSGACRRLADTGRAAWAKRVTSESGR